MSEATVQARIGGRRESGAERVWVWPTLTLVCVLVAALVPLIFLPQYYYAADTSQGAYGTWYHLGMELRAGHWPLLNPSVWGSGNYIAEGQWGLYSPLVWLIGLGASFAPNVVVYASFIKIAFMLVAAGGLYVLARSYAVAAPLASVAGVVGPLSGFTLYMDAPSWVTNLFVWSLLPWLWWALRRSFRGASPWPAFLVAAAIVTIGYVHGTIMVFVLLAGMLVEAVITRSKRQVIIAVAVAVATGLLAITVFLPGVASADVTARNSTSIANSGFLVMDGTGLASAIIPTVQSQVIGWWGNFSPGPITYIAWILPLIVLLDPRRLRCVWPDAVPALALVVVAGAFVFGPSDVGPLRYPMRLLPFLTLGIVLLTVLCLDRARRTAPGRGSVVAVILIAVASTYLAMAQVPDHWRVQAVVGALVACALASVVMLFRQASRWGSDIALRRVGVTTVLVTVGFVGVQHYYFDGTQTSGDSDYPAALADYQTQVAQGTEDGIVVGDPLLIGGTDEIFSETLVANTWYMNPHVAMQNTYTTIFHVAYAADVCMNHLGATCPEVLDTLFAKDETTGLPLVDLLSIDTVQIIKEAVPERRRSETPAGWHVADEGQHTVTWVREDPVGGAGQVVWSTPGIDSTMVLRSASEVQIRVDEVPEEGGQIVLSRLDWPGYLVENARLGEPLRGYLVTVDVPESAKGEVVTVRFRPPFWNLELAALGLAVVVILTMSVLGARNRWGRRGAEPVCRVRDESGE